MTKIQRFPKASIRAPWSRHKLAQPRLDTFGQQCLLLRMCLPHFASSYFMFNVHPFVIVIKRSHPTISEHKLTPIIAQVENESLQITAEQHHLEGKPFLDPSLSTRPHVGTNVRKKITHISNHICSQHGPRHISSSKPPQTQREHHGINEAMWTSLSLVD